MSNYIFYLASGNSVRFGKNKLLADFNGKPLFSHGLDTIAEAFKNNKNCTVTVVSQYPEIRSYAISRNLKAINSPESKSGMSYTIKNAVLSIADLHNDDFIMFSAADQPYIKKDSIQKLMSLAVPHTQTARLFFHDTPGNPVLFSAMLAPELMKLQGDSGGGKITKNHDCLHIPVSDPLELMDIDTIDDLNKYNNNFIKR